MVDLIINFYFVQVKPVEFISILQSLNELTHCGKTCLWEDASYIDAEIVSKEMNCSKIDQCLLHFIF